MTNIQCVSPVDNRLYAERETFSREMMQVCLKKAVSAKNEWHEVPLEKKIQCIMRAVSNLQQLNPQAVEELAWQMGRPVRYKGEIGAVIERAEYMSSIANGALEPIRIETSERFERYIAREPVGIVLVIAPWNYPYLTSLNTIIPGLLAGNAVFLKHAAQTVLVGERIKEAFENCGLPEGLFQNIRLTHEQTSQLIADGAFNFVNFTGSVTGGRAIEQAAAGTFTSVGLELGGKDPALVRSDADITATVTALVDGAMYNSGQCCCGIERIYVADAVYDDFVEQARVLTEHYVLGNPLDMNTTIGPMAKKSLADTVRAQINNAVAAGARQIVDLSVFTADDGKTAYLAPQILIDVNHSMRVMQEESFGPVVCIMKVSNDQQAIDLMNDSPYGLTASIWTDDIEAARSIGQQIQTGTVFMNRCDYVDPALCWTGCKDTGRGTTLSALGYQSLTRPKSFHLRKA